jgi:hypothetical protein
MAKPEHCRRPVVRHLQGISNGGSLPGVFSFRRIFLLVLAAGIVTLPVQGGDFFASSAWQAVGRSPAVETAADGKAVFPCTPKPSGTFWRRSVPQKISWKRDVSADWRDAAGFVFSFDMEPPENFLDLEIRLLSPSGGDWRAQKRVMHRDASLRLPRAAFRPVGNAGAFGEVSGVQVCVSLPPEAGGPSLFRRLFPVKKKRTLRARSWEVLSDGRLCVLRVPGGEQGADDLSSSLFAAGFPHVVRPAEEAGDALAAAEAAVVFFPSPPAKPLREALSAFLARGGKLGTFYDLGPALASAMGFRSGPFRRVPGGGSFRGLAFDGLSGTPAVFAPQNHWVEGAPASPEASVAAHWMDADEPAALASPKGFWVTAPPTRLDARGTEDALAALLAGCGGDFARVAESHFARRASEDNSLHRVIQLLPEVYARTPNETRGIWATGPLPQGWPATAERLRSSGFNRVYVRAGKGLSAGNGLAEALSACSGEGLAVHAWFVLFDLAGETEETLASLEAAGRLAADADGKRRAWLSPHHPENQALCRRTVAELLRAHPGLAGVHFDYLREPDGGDWSRAALDAFARATGRGKVERADVLAGGADEAAFRRWRADDLAAFLARLRAAAKAESPACTVSAAVYPLAGKDGGAIAQDWRRWLREGLLDEAVPMNYTEDLGELAAWLAQEPLAGGKILSGLAISAAGVHPPVADLLLQMALSRNAGAAGSILFSLTEAADRRLFPFLEEAERGGETAK